MSRISKDAKQLAERIAEAEKSDLFLYNGPINEDGFGACIQNLSHEHESVILLLCSNGGSANSAFRIARLYQSFYKTFAVWVPSVCKSAGTLICVGAQRFLMPDFAELGPLDVQLSRRDELWERRSGLLLRSALTSLKESAEDLFRNIMISIKGISRGNVRFKLASEIAGELTKGLLDPIYAQITPEALGEDWQELHVAIEYGKRLAEVGRLVSELGINKLVCRLESNFAIG